jgi:hypothetical protein
MKIRSRLLSLFLFVALLIIAGFIAEGNVRFLLNEFWFNAGLFMLILAVFIDQPFFSTESNIILNGAAAAISLIGVKGAERNAIWWILLLFSAYLIIASYFIAYYRSAKTATKNNFIDFIKNLNRKLGRPQVLFSVLFIWGSIMKFGLSNYRANFLYFYWAFFILFDFIKIGYRFDRILYPSTKPSAKKIGIIRKLIEPNLVEVELGSDVIIELGIRIDFLNNNKIIASGILIDDRAMSGLRIGRIVLDKKESEWTSIITASPDRLSPEVHESHENPNKFIGIVEAGTDISTLRTLVRPDCDIMEGSLLEINYSDNKKAYYQVAGGQVTDITTEGNAMYRSVTVFAEQLGFWSESSCFESVPWVAPANAPIYVIEETNHTCTVSDERIIVGSIPNSDFPIHIGIEDLVTHNSAILGVTGSGKSYLAFYLVEGLLNKNIRVLIFDHSRQHRVFLGQHSPVQIKNDTELKAWLESESLLGIYEYQFSGTQLSFPEVTAKFLAIVFDKMTRGGALRPDEAVTARLCIVLEEAHSLIPEFNQVTDRNDSIHVNRSARLLLQGRKYGVGVIVITQRTANVVKTVLNQCNTIFALQCFDQTGLEFLQNYIGARLAQALSILPKYHAILVGKASSSARPVIFKVSDLSKRWCSPAEKETTEIK